MELSNKILSDITVYMKYAKFVPELNRRETWEELVTRNKNMHIKNHLFAHKISIYDAFKLLDNFIDVSDPDINLPNLHHLLQTAEAIR